MRIINLGCGTKTCQNPDVINIDWSIYLVLKKKFLPKNFIIKIA